VKGVPGIEHLADAGYGMVLQCCCGNVPSFVRPNQDDYFYAITEDGYHIAGVFDGHGRDGHVLAAAARNRIMRHLFAALPQNDKGGKGMGELADCTMDAIAEAFDAAHQEIIGMEGVDAALSGVAACVLVHNVKRKWMATGWTGNARCIVAEGAREGEDGFTARTLVSETARKSKKGKNKMTVVAFSQDHDLEDRKEKKRVKRAGAELRPDSNQKLHIYAPDEEWPGLPITRCLGNLLGQHLGVVATADIMERSVENESIFAVMATDGIWEVMEEQEIVQMLAETKQQNMQYGLDNIFEIARRRWATKPEAHGTVDDMTMFVIWLAPKRKSSFESHG